jgi:hypothetical protein
MSKKHATTENCIYCGVNEVSEEDVFPKWLQRRFKRPEDSHGTLERIPNLNSEVRIERSVRVLKVAVEAVCFECNNTWMSGLQNNTKPIIASLLDETTTSLTPEECRQLTCWVVMSAMCLEANNPRSKWLYDDLDRTLLKEKEIPRNTEVWIGYWMNAPGEFYEGRLGYGTHYKGYVCTFGFGNLLFQLLHNVQSDRQPRNWNTLSAPWNEMLIPIRFPKPPVILPTKQPIQGEDGFSALSSRFLNPTDGENKYAAALDLNTWFPVRWS